MNSNSISSYIPLTSLRVYLSLLVFGSKVVLIEQFEKCVDALHQLAANLGPRALDEMHRDPPRGAVGERHLRVIDGVDGASSKMRIP